MKIQFFIRIFFCINFLWFNIFVYNYSIKIKLQCYCVQITLIHCRKLILTITDQRLVCGAISANVMHRVPLTGTKNNLKPYASLLDREPLHSIALWNLYSMCSFHCVVMHDTRKKNGFFRCIVSL